MKIRVLYKIGIQIIDFAILSCLKIRKYLFFLLSTFDPHYEKKVQNLFPN